MSERGDLLKEAILLIEGDRDASYGEPVQDFARIAALWTVLFGAKLKDGEAFTSHEVAMALIVLKLSRLCHSPGKQDNWTDIAGYAGCGWECAVREAGQK